MKKRVLFFACIGMLFSVGTKAQVVAFEAKWESSGTGTSTYQIAKSVNGSVTAEGIEIGAGVVTSSSRFNFAVGNLGVSAYTSSSLAALSSISGGWARITNASITLGTAYDAANYIQLKVTANSDKFLRVSALNFLAMGGGSGANRLVIKSSKTGLDNDFQDINMPFTCNIADGTTVQYAGTEADPIALVASNVSTARTEAERSVDVTGLTINVGKGESVYIRVYPYNTSGGSRYLFLKSAKVTGLTSDSTLPLDLLSFSAKPGALGKTVNLAWKTANEVNTQDFLVERRSDNTEFSTVGTVLSKNTAGTHSYSFTDSRPLSGISYYRLKQRDKDGKYSYSEATDVKIENISLNIFPNPVGKELVISHEYVKQPSAFKVVGLDGKNLIKANTSVGSSSTTINVSALPSGTYVLVYEGEGKPQSQKFIKK